MVEKKDEERQRKKIEEKIEIPEGIKVEVDNNNVTASNGKGTLKANKHNFINISVKDNQIILTAANLTKRGKKIVGTYKAHIKNMINGLKESFKYTLKVCSGHFPMNVSVSNNQLVVKNFLGEKTPRTLKLREGVTVKVEGDKVIVESPNRSLAGQTAADIESLCKINNRDSRIFQDGIWIVNKAGKEIK